MTSKTKKGVNIKAWGVSSTDIGEIDFCDFKYFTFITRESAKQATKTDVYLKRFKNLKIIPVTISYKDIKKETCLNLP